MCFLRSYLFSFAPRRSRVIRDGDFFSMTFGKTQEAAASNLSRYPVLPDCNVAGLTEGFLG